MTLETFAHTVATNYSYLLYILIALFAFFESIPFFGVFIPGQILVMIAGFLARLNGISMTLVIILATVFAFLGEIYAFNIGRKYGFSLVKRYGKYVFITQENFNYIKGLMHHHTAKTLLFGRFNSLTRALSPFTAGASNLRRSRFMKYSFIGSLLWAVTFTLLGYIFAEGYKAAAKTFSTFVVTATFLVIAILLCYRFMNKRKHAYTRSDFYKLIAGILSLYICAKVSESVITNDNWILKLDLITNTFFKDIYNPIIGKFFIVLTNVLQPTILVLLGVFLAYILYKKGSRKRSAVIVVSLLLGAASELIMSILIKHPRPLDSIIYAPGYSLPSGHATMACIFFLLLIYTLKNNWSKITKVLLTVGSIILIILVSISRLYLGVHWLSDIIAGLALGIFWVTLSILAIKYIDSEYKEDAKMAKLSFKNRKH